MRFLHTGDWQLGMRRHFLGEEAQARFAEARFAAVRRLGEVARQEGCELVVVAGDTFESNQLDRRTVLRALDAMADAGVPIYLLPGNHDPLDAASVYRSRVFREGCPPNVTVLADRKPVEVAPGVEVVGAPWFSKRPLQDLVGALAAELEPARGRLRIAVAHGAVDTLSPDRDDPARIELTAARRALEEGRFHYLALGDRHSATEVDERIWYAGTPEATDFDEERPGRVLRVELTEDGCEVEERPVGAWWFLRREIALAGDAGVETVAETLEAIPEKTRTALRLGLVGELSLHARARLDEVLAVAGERFAALEPWQPKTDLVVVPDRLDRDELALSGFAREALDELLAASRQPADPAAAVARDALTLLYRLARGLD